MYYTRALKVVQKAFPKKARLTKQGEIRIGTSCPITYVGSVLAGCSLDPEHYEHSVDALNLDFAEFGLHSDQFTVAADTPIAKLNNDPNLIAVRKRLLKLFNLKEAK